MVTETLHSAVGGNFFEDFHVGRHFRHPTPRTITDGDASLYIALTGARQPLFCSTPLAQSYGLRTRPIDDLLLFNTAFGKTVADISSNAVANLGYADVRFLAAVYAGDTLRAESEVIGLRPASDGKSGVVYVRSHAFNQDDVAVLTWVRWVLVRKRDPAAAVAEAIVPDLPESVPPDQLNPLPLRIDTRALELATGSSRYWDSYAIGDRIDHPAGMTLDESDHTLATKLYQNTAKVHFDALAMRDTPHGRRLVYGGHVLSVCRALSYDGMENLIGIGAINGGSHSAPTFAGDTLYCFSEVKDKFVLPGRSDCAALRLRLVGIKNHPAAGFDPTSSDGGKTRLHPDVVLDLDFTAFIPRG
jgi:2-methylfumaryl-CoA hydratase